MANVSPQRMKQLAAAKAARDMYDATFVNWLASMVKHKEASAIRKASRLLSVRGGELLKACEAANLNAPNLTERHDLKIKSLTPAQRTCLSVYLKGGLTGRARQLWIDEGLTLTEQIDRDRLAGRVPPSVRPVKVDDGRVKTFTAAQVATRLNVSTRTVTATATDMDLNPRALTKIQAQRIAKAIKYAREILA